MLHTWSQLRQLLAAGARAEFSRLRGPQFVAQRLTSYCSTAELPKALDLLLCFGAEREAEAELLIELSRPDVLRLLSNTLESGADASVKEKVVILLQHLLKR